MNTKLALIPVLMLVGCSSMTIHERCMELTSMPEGLSKDSTDAEIIAHYKVKTVDEALEKALRDGSYRWEFQRHGSLERCYAQKLADDKSWVDLVANAGDSFRNASKMSPEAEKAYHENQRHMWDAGNHAPQPQTVILQVEGRSQPAQYRPFK